MWLKRARHGQGMSVAVLRIAMKNTRSTVTLILVLAAAMTACSRGSESQTLHANAPAAGNPAAAATPASATIPESSATPTPAPAAAPTADPARPAAPETSAAPAPAYRDITVPAGTTLAIDLGSAVASDSSHVEDPVRGTLRRGIRINGVEAIPAGTRVLGYVTEATRSGRVKGRARIAFRFTQLDLPGPGERVAIRTGTIAREAQATKKDDAVKIGAGAAAGTVIGAIVGGGDGAAKGAAIGGGAGTGVVLATRGKEVRLVPGTDLSVKLQQPITIRVRS
jgi:hypothetical protein